ncbi:MAG: nucleoside:proton symporter [Desulfuromonas sp.]|nr:MAG: nucleoside:proton symporter [Desulfuromonas sp.]
MQSVAGLFVLMTIAWLLSEERRSVPRRIVVVGLLLQFLLALLLLKVPYCQSLFLWLNDLVLALDRATSAGTAMVFGYLGGAELPFKEAYPGASFILAFRALPLVLVVSALSALLFYWRVLPVIVNFFSRLLQKALGIGGAVGVSAAANIFIGMVEAPLLIRPYLLKMSRSELFMVMTCGMSTIAGTVLVLYASILSATIPDAIGHILTASLISAPAAIIVASLMVPPKQQEMATEGDVALPNTYNGSMDAITRGTAEGLSLLLNIVAMLIVLVALVSLGNIVLGLLPTVAGAELSLQRIFGWLLAPVAWLIGIPWSEAATAGTLLGTKVVLNELIAYLDLANLSDSELSVRSRLIMTYALCGFANFGSLGIMIGGIGSMAPERRSDVVSLGLKSIVAGLLATCMTGAVVSLIL